MIENDQEDYWEYWKRINSTTKPELNKKLVRTVIVILCSIALGLVLYWHR